MQELRRSRKLGYHYQKTTEQLRSGKIAELGHHPQTLIGSGADDRIRTGDLLITNQLHYHCATSA